MKIAIAGRYRPFSHEAGSSCLLPGTSWIVQAFPTLIRLHSAGDAIELSLSLQGPVREFTLQQDLEKGAVLIWGVAKEGRFRLKLHATSNGILLAAEKTPPEGLKTNRGTFAANESFLLKEVALEPKIGPCARLSLGNHRAQDWDLVRRRCDLVEILPILFHLSQWMPEVPKGSRFAMHELLDRGFEEFFRAGFSGILSPRLIDADHQGLVARENVPETASPLSLITEAGKKIQSLFVVQKQGAIQFVSPSFLSGRITNLRLAGIGAIDLDWSKQTIRQAILRAEFDGNIRIELPKPLSSFRLRKSLQEKGRRIETQELVLKAGEVYFMDRFQK